jgi:flagellar biosynthetic protein FliO
MKVMRGPYIAYAAFTLLGGTSSSVHAAAALAPGQVLQVTTGLGIVLAMIALVAWFARRMQRLGPAAKGHIRIIETLGIGTRERIVLIEVDEVRLLIGQCPGHIVNLHAFASHEKRGFNQELAVAMTPDKACST